MAPVFPGTGDREIQVQWADQWFIFEMTCRWRINAPDAPRIGDPVRHPVREVPEAGHICS